MSEAKSHYQIVVDEYIKRGKAREAGDVLKKMAEIDPGDLKVRSKLADLYTREGSSGKAVEEHIAIAEELHKKGHLAEALQVLEKGLKLDPSSARLRSELARIHLVQRNYDKAGHFLEEALKSAPNDPEILARLGEAYLGAKKIHEAEAILKRLLALNPANDDARAQMARVYLQQGQLDQAFEQVRPVVDRLLEHRDTAKAATLLQQIVQKNPAHTKSLQKLADVYKAGQNETALVTTYSQLAEAYINQKDFAQAATALGTLVQREPQNQQHRTKLDFVKSKLGGRAASPGPAAAAPTPEPMPEPIEEEFDLGVQAESGTFDLGASEPAPPPAARPPGRTTAPARRPAIEASGPLSDEDREFIEEHLGEGRVFRKYGLIDKAADQFEAVVARFPDNVDARKELLDVYKEKGLTAKAAEQSMALGEIYRLKGDAAAAESHEAEAQRLAPEVAAPPAAKAPAPAPVARPAAKPAAVPPPAPAPAAEESELMFEEAAPIVSSDEEEISLEVEEHEPAAPAAEEESIDLGAEVGGDEELPARFFDDEAGAGAAAPAAEVELAIESSPGDELALEEEPAPPPPPAPLKAAPAPRPPPPKAPVAPARTAPAKAPAVTGVPPELQRVLEEVEQYVSLGFIDDAKEALREVSARHRGHPAIQAQLAQLGLDLAEEPEAPAFPAASLDESLDLGGGEPEPPAAEPGFAAGLTFEAEASAPADSGLDLSDELGELFGAQDAVEEEPAAASTDLGDAGLADIFKEFKKGVDKQLGKEDYDTRYNLGIAYKEMGLLDEAIAEFQLAAKDEKRILECSSMLGICFMEKGMPKLAVKWFEKGLQAPGRSDEEYAGLRYDLAMAYEADGALDKALSLFTDLYGQDANFRDVAAKVRELRGAVG
jgi:tetratricopeptide (TPR) repeat protein